MYWARGSPSPQRRRWLRRRRRRAADTASVHKHARAREREKASEDCQNVAVGGGSVAVDGGVADMALTTAQLDHRVRPVGTRVRIDLRQQKQGILPYITVECDSDRAASVCSDLACIAKDCF